MRFALALVLVDCRDSQVGPDAAPPFHLHVEIGWSTQDSPDITAVTVDGSTLAPNTSFIVDEDFDSYTDAVGRYAPKSVAITTTAGTASVTVGMHTCGSLEQTQVKALGRLIAEKDIYDVRSSSVDWFGGACAGVDQGIAITPRARTR